MARKDEEPRGNTALKALYWGLLASVLAACAYVIWLAYQGRITTSMAVLLVVCLLYSGFVYLVGSAAKSFQRRGFLLNPLEFIWYFFNIPFFLIKEST